jgi:KaiC/GvpD/RAD55 family RecA-like ATPase
VVFRALDAAKIKFRRGEVSMIAAAPGVGKSMLSLNLAVRAGVPTLYCSPDTSASDMEYRAAAVLTGDSLSEIENAYANGRSRFYESILDQKLGHMRTVPEGPLTFDELESEIEAFEEVFGESPALIVIDNLRDIETETDGQSWERYDVALDYLKTMARATGACILVLHHLTGAHNNGDKNAGQSGIEGQATKVLSMVLTLAIGGGDGAQTLKVCAVKNRSGRSDPSGSSYVEIPYAPERAGLG